MGIGWHPHGTTGLVSWVKHECMPVILAYLWLHECCCNASVLLCMLNGCLMLCKAACCDPSQQLPGLVQLLSLFFTKQQAADNAMHTNSGDIAIGKLHMRLYNASVLTMKYAHLVLNSWRFTMPIVGMVSFGDRALDPASTQPRAWDRVHWTQLDQPKQWTSDPSEWASDPSANKLRCKNIKHKP